MLQRGTCLPENKPHLPCATREGWAKQGRAWSGEIVFSRPDALSGSWAVRRAESQRGGPRAFLPPAGEGAGLSPVEVHGVRAQSRRDWNWNFISQEGFTELPPHTKLLWDTPSQSSVRTLLRLLRIKMLWEQLQGGSNSPDLVSVWSERSQPFLWELVATSLRSPLKFPRGFKTVAAWYLRSLPSQWSFP